MSDAVILNGVKDPCISLLFLNRQSIMPQSPKEKNNDHQT